MPRDCQNLMQAALCLLSSGQNEEAVPILEQALRQDPESADAFRALAEAHLGCGSLDEARRCCQKSVAINKTFDRGHFMLGVICAHTGDLDHSITALERAIELRPGYADAIRALAAVTNRSGNLSRALQCYRELIQMGIDDSEILQEFASAAERHGVLNEAITAREELLRRDPDDSENQFNLSSLNGEAPPAVAPATMVVKTFNDYAETFETHLGKLGYRGPQLLWDAIQKQETRAELRVLDLGCGTGLCGQTFRSIASELVGIDLSQKMLEQAKAKGVYDQLHCAEVHEFLSREGLFDLILAGDLLIYLGDLLPTFKGARDRIAPGGRFALTVEQGDDQEIAVSRSHRYLHSTDYVRRIAAETRWRIESIDDCVLRQEGTHDVAGFVVVMRSTET